MPFILAAELETKAETFISAAKLTPPYLNQYYLAKLPIEVVIESFIEFVPFPQALAIMFTCRTILKISKERGLFQRYLAWKCDTPELANIEYHSYLLNLEGEPYFKF